MHTTLLTTGLVCMIAAIVGGGLKAFVIEVPAFQSTRRQVALGLFGLVLFVAGLSLSPKPSPSPPSPQPGTQDPAPLPAASQTATNRYVLRCTFAGDAHIYYVKADNEIIGLAPSGQQVSVGRRLPPSLPNASWMYHRYDNNADYAVDAYGRIWAPYLQNPIGQASSVQ